MSFEQPTAVQCLAAIGPTEGLPETLRRALDPGYDFEPMPKPNPGDWLAVHPESGQTFDQFVKSAPNRPGKPRTRLYLQPLGDFPNDCAPSPATLREYAAAYFAMDVALLPEMNMARVLVGSRTNPYSRNRQLLTGEVLGALKKGLPSDAFCLLGVTMEDLYPDPSWNFVFGQASLTDRVGVYSFARFDPAFYDGPRGADCKKILLRRSCRVLTHETGHMFGLLHCIYFGCVMNGSNHLEESDARPLHLCPVCLRKVQYSAGFDVVENYLALLRFYLNVEFDDEARWTAHRLEKILAEPQRR